jgi:predicted NAD-dependent protein-ADP-ribosyltransferase YbiA (DUF1768 family)
MDIRSNNSYPSCNLSNFYGYKFEFDGVECNSMEGLLQSFKFENHIIQIEVCKLVGIAAKRRGQKRNKVWKSVQTLWWKGKAYKRDSKDYQCLLDDAFNALFNNKYFRKALCDTGDVVLTHSIGNHKQHETVLTISEFIFRLNKLRKEVQGDKSKISKS